MNLHFCHTKSHGILVQHYFLPTVPLSFQPVGVACTAIGEGNFLSPEFAECVLFKMEKIVQSIEDHFDELIAWSDVDIVFFSDPVNELRTLLNGNSELLFQREWRRHNEVNVGFFACRATARTHKFFSQVYKAMLEENGSNDQVVVNRLLGNTDLPWGHLPDHYYARSHGELSDVQAVLYHANCTAGAHGVQQKIRQFEALEPLNRVRHIEAFE
jgi:hypothetical protein